MQLVVIGSSLKVAPVADVKERIPDHVPQILINLETLPHMESFDIQLLGYCDTITTEISRMLGWMPPREDDEIIYRPGPKPHVNLI